MGRSRDVVLRYLDAFRFRTSFAPSPIAVLDGGASHYGPWVFSFLNRFAPDFSATELSDLTQRPVEVTYTFNGLLVTISRLSSEPLPRIAQRIERRTGLSGLGSSGAVLLSREASDP